jgi:predicted membrane-bound mannosyltransferase
MDFFRNEIKVVFQITVGVCAALVAVVGIRMDIRDSRNDRMRSLCAVYWGAPDGSA